VATHYTVTITCDEGTSPGCHVGVSATRASPREFDHYATELFQRGWIRGFRQTDPSPGATSETLVAYDVCPACAGRRPLPGGDPPP
jgi:hypothetical protein